MSIALLTAVALSAAAAGSAAPEATTARTVRDVDAGPQGEIVTGAPANSQLVGEVVVTAKLQAQVVEAGPFGTVDILKTPYSVNSLTGDALEVSQTRTLLELQKIDPSIQFQVSGIGTNLVAIRGFTADVRLDGVRSGLSTQFPLEFLERVDVVKGASTFLYGFAAPGGVIDYQLKRPTAAPLRTAYLGYDSDSAVTGRLDVSQPLGPDAGVRANLLVERGENYLDGNDLDRTGVSLTGAWRPTPTLRLDADFTYLRDAPSSGGAAIVYAPPGVDVSRPLDPTRRLLEPWERFRTESYVFGVGGEWAFAPDWSLAVRVRGYLQPRSYFSSGGLLLDATGKATDLIYAFNDEQDEYAQEAKVTGVARLGPTTHHLAFGYDRQDSPTYDANNSLSLFFGPYPTTTSPNDPRPASFRIPDDPLRKNSRALENSGYAADRIEWGPWTALLAGRYIDFSQTGYDLTTQGVASRYHASKFTPAVGLLRAFGPVTAYVSYAEGLEKGGDPPRAAVNFGQPLPPISSSQEEVGVKAKLFGAVTATAALFNVDRDYEYLRTTGGVLRYVNDGTETHRGVEANVSGEVAPGWNVIAGITYLDAKVKGTADPTLNGSRPYGVSDFQASFFLERRLTPNLYAKAGVFHAGAKELDFPNSRTIDGYTTVDAGLRWVGEVAGRKVSVNAEVDNLTDERYYGGVYFGFLSLGIPRQAKLTVSAGF